VKLESRAVERRIGFFRRTVMVMQVRDGGHWRDASLLDYEGVERDENKREARHGLFPVGAPVMNGAGQRGRVVFQEPDEGQVYVQYEAGAAGTLVRCIGNALMITGDYLSPPTKTIIQIGEHHYYSWWCALGLDKGTLEVLDWLAENVERDLYEVTASRWSGRDPDIKLVGFVNETDADLFYLRWR
jgi:hypothetical protein